MNISIYETHPSSAAFSRTIQIPRQNYLTFRVSETTNEIDRKKKLAAKSGISKCAHIAKNKRREKEVEEGKKKRPQRNWYEEKEEEVWLIASTCHILKHIQRRLVFSLSLFELIVYSH